jgi:hypothetical protein
MRCLSTQAALQVLARHQNLPAERQKAHTVHIMKPLILKPVLMILPGAVFFVIAKRPGMKTKAKKSRGEYNNEYPRQCQSHLERIAKAR